MNAGHKSVRLFVVEIAVIPLVFWYLLVHVEHPSESALKGDSNSLNLNAGHVFVGLFIIEILVNSCVSGSLG